MSRLSASHVEMWNCSRGDDFRPQAEAVHGPVKHVTYGEIAAVAVTSAEQALQTIYSHTHDER